MIDVTIAINPFPGSPEWAHAAEAGTLRRCGLDGCEAQVTFWCKTSDEWVCFEHGALVLKQEWGLFLHELTVHGKLGGRDDDAHRVRQANLAHDIAMRWARAADAETDAAKKREAFKQAFEHEREAARLAGTVQPSRAVLFRSAGWLAFEAGELVSARIMVEQGMEHNPPEAIRVELDELKIQLEATDVV